MNPFLTTRCLRRSIRMLAMCYRPKRLSSHSRMLMVARSFLSTILILIGRHSLHRDASTSRTRKGDHIGPLGTAGTKTTADYEADDKLIIQAADPLTAPKITITLSSGPTVFGSGDGAGKYYSYSAIAVDVDFALDASDSYRVSLDAHPVIQIPAGNIKGNKWVELSAGNLEEFEGDPTHVLTANATGVKETAVWRSPENNRQCGHKGSFSQVWNVRQTTKRHRLRIISVSTHR